MKIAFLTAGGIAPCLSSSIGALIEQYAKRKPEAKMIGYLNGYRGLLLGKSIVFPESVKNNFTSTKTKGKNIQIALLMFLLRLMMAKKS